MIIQCLLWLESLTQLLPEMCYRKTILERLPNHHPHSSEQNPWCEYSFGMLCFFRKFDWFHFDERSLRNFDASNVGTRGGSSAPSPPRVSGIGGKGEVTPPPNECTPKQKPMILPSTGAKPDYSEAKIVVAMVGPLHHLHLRLGL